MDLIFHEKQEGSLCAQHCLNALLQGPYFTPVDLATLAQRMDDEERTAMAESGVDTEEYRLFLQQPSGNMDDSGFFSVQVISAALAVWSLDLVPYKSPESATSDGALIENPEDRNAYICNYREHWFTIRKLGRQWFNLNSLLSGPELISTTYLSIFLATLQAEGLMSIALQDEDDPGLAAALRVSLEAQPDRTNSQSTCSVPPSYSRVDSCGSDEALLSEAIRLSLEGHKPQELTGVDAQERTRSSHPSSLMQPSEAPNLDEIRRRRLAYLDKRKS